MKISFIGSGNVATHLALAFRGCGHFIDQIYSPHFSHAELLAQRVGAEPTSDIHQLHKDADVYILAISDNALFDLALDLHFGDALVVHTSGATSIEVLKHVSSRYGVIWSPQTFNRDVAMEYSELPFCIEGNTPVTTKTIADLVGSISTLIYHTTQEQRQYLHLGAVFVNNFTNGLVGLAQEICRKHDVPFEVLHTIMLTTARRAQYGDVRHHLTGPAIRHDDKTLNAHRRLLKDDPQILNIYNEMTSVIQEVLDD